MIQLLNENGLYKKHLVYEKYIKQLKLEKIINFYRDMCLVRIFDHECINLQRCGKISLWPPLLGQEAAQIGSGIAIKEKQNCYVFPSYREHGVALSMGIKVENLIRMFQGNTYSGWNTKKYNFHYYTLVLAAQVLHATGYAMGICLKKSNDKFISNNTSVIAYFGDGATSQGDIHESMVYAASFKAPIIFFCQNNQWAVSTPSKLQSRISLYNRAKGYGMPGIKIDGNDILAVYAVTSWALDHVSSGQGPVFIEAYTDRMGAHTTADDPTKYRKIDNYQKQQWIIKDPLLRLKKYLQLNQAYDQNLKSTLKQQSELFLTEIRNSVDLEFTPNLEGIFKTIYCEKNSLVQEELEYFKKYESQFYDNIFNL